MADPKKNAAPQDDTPKTTPAGEPEGQGTGAENDAENDYAAEDAAAEEERRRRREELFGDILDDEDAPADTIESLRAERDELQQKFIQVSGRIGTLQQDSMTARNKLEEAQKALTRAEAKFEQDKKFAVEKFVKEVLPVIDTLELGLSAIPQKDRDSDPKFAKLAEGVEKTINQLTQVFNKFGIKSINPMGEEFDPSKHEALAVQPKDGVDPETVIQVAQKGYEIEGRLIRPAKVIITPQF
ncbi:MAG: nucleotide exchange factor GrpE [Alphaproteobacteria bacterium]|nr:nucleotide exchange factor GrpE [Alphaproteobacteria bacterium]